MGPHTELELSCEGGASRPLALNALLLKASLVSRPCFARAPPQFFFALTVKLLEKTQLFSDLSR